MRNGNEKEIDLLKFLLHSGTEEKNESDEKDSYLAVVLLLRFCAPAKMKPPASKHGKEYINA